MIIDRTRIQDFLLQLPLFNELAPTELARLANATSEISVPRGDMVFHRGEPCVGFHAVIYGQIKLMFVSPLGDEKVVRLLGSGDTFGEALMFMGKDYIVSAQALEDTLLLHVGKAAVFAELDNDTGFARKMLAGLSKRLHVLMADVEAYSLKSGMQRIIGYLLQGGPYQNGDRFRLETTKTVIASRLNLTPEHFSRIMHDLGSRGLIKIKGREITIVDIEGLRRFHD
ncbi:MAG: Crp/Fnr family transcriptional regulator [Burkholderiaceae bacterium]|nr:Crp/Fnr family transcriptional regulator [Burkholderiaceae bacterium]